MNEKCKMKNEKWWYFSVLRKRKYLNFSFLILSFTFFPACQIEPQVPKDTLRVEMGAEPDTLNPILASDAYASQINGYVNDSLIERNRDTLAIEPKLAESWKISRDHLKYTFYLRKDVRWHDGVPFTADDVVTSFETIQNPKVEAPFLRVYYADIIKVEKVDDTTVNFFYKKPYFLGLSVCGDMPLLPRHIYENNTDFNHHPANRAPLGTGPYKFVEWKTNKRIILERNEDYWGKKPDIKRIEFKIVTDEAVSLQLLKKGEIDMAGLRPIQWVRQTESEKFNTLFNKYSYTLPGYNYIGWNNASVFFSDRRVRLAMTHLVDRRRLLEKIQFGLGVIVESPFFVEGPQYDADLQTIPYDPDEARRLFTDAGWLDTDGDGWLDKDGKKFEFTFLYPAAAKFTERLSTILKEDLKKLGIKMSIERMEWAAFLAKIEKKDFDATALGWSSGFEDDPYQLWHSSQAKMDRGSNFVSFVNPEADSLIERARVEFNEKRRNELYWKLQEIIHQEQPYTFLFANKSLVVVSKRFDNVIIHKAGLDIREWKVK